MMVSPHMTYEGKKVTIVGLGREGRALARFLAQRGAQVTVTDRKEESQLHEAMEDLGDLPVRYVLGGHPAEVLDAEIMFVSPGVPRDAPILAEALRGGLELSSETRLFFALCPAPIIGITGSSGKTTTTSLVGEMLKASGRLTHIGGNIGSPLIELVERIRPQDAVVMELSSFQLESLEQSPHIGAVLNISPNHLDRHQSMDDYVAAKTNIIRYQSAEDYAVLHGDQDASRQLARLCTGQVVHFSSLRPVARGAFLDEDRVTARWQDRSFVVCESSEIPLRGAHNVENVLAACAIALAAGASAEAMRSAVIGFRGVEHRLELAGEINGAQYFDDSIATSPERTMAALNSFSEPIILLAGGREKHLPLESLSELILSKVKALVLFGEAAPLLEQAVQRARKVGPQRELPIYKSSDMREAVETAARLAERGDVVLLSPACTSFDMYRDFAERGDHFKSLVDEMIRLERPLADSER
jgi:UDP-N-acetylmuramoylalanine--D-glutamate ligase